jgi:hypothetical protein
MKLEDSEAQRLLTALVAVTGEDPAQALRMALQERLAREKREAESDLVRDRSEELFGY